MTLIIAQRNKDYVSFSSDSRISFGDYGYFDKGIKIFSVPFKLKGLVKSLEDLEKYEFENQYGFAIVGSSTNANTVKDSIVELLTNTTYLSNLSEVSLYSIGSIIFKVYKEVSEEITKVMRENGLCEIILGGFCLQQKRIRVLRFYPIPKSDKVEYNFEEILKSESIEFFGSGKDLAEEIWNENKDLEPLQILKKVILSEKEITVGGPLQFGYFPKNNFKVTGVIETELDEYDNEIKTEKYRRGLKVENEISEMRDYPYIGFSYTYKPVKYKR